MSKPLVAEVPAKSSQDILCLTIAAVNAVKHDNLPHQVLADAMEENGHPAYVYLADLLRKSVSNKARMIFREAGFKGNIYRNSDIPTVEYTCSKSYFPKPRRHGVCIIVPEPSPSQKSLRVMIRTESLANVRKHLEKLHGFNNVEKALEECLARNLV